MTPEELVEDAEAIGGLEVVGEPEHVTSGRRPGPLTFPAQEHKLAAGPGRRSTRRRAGRRARSSSSTARSGGSSLRRGPTLEDVPLPRALIPGGPYHTDAQEDALDAPRPLAARRRPALPGARVGAAREPFAAHVQTTDLDEMKALVLSLDGRHLVIQGPPGSGKTWTSGRLIAHLLGAGQARRRRLDEPQGDPQAARRGREAAGSRPRRSPESRRRAPATPSRSTTSSTTIEKRDRAGSSAATATLTGGTAWLFSREEHRRHARLPVHRRGGPGLARRRARDGDAARGTSCSSATRSSSRRCSRASHPGRRRRPRCSSTCSATTRRSRPTAACSSSGRTGCTPTSAATSRRSSTKGGSSPTPCATTRTTPLGTGLRFLPVEHEGSRQESPEEAARVAGTRSSGCSRRASPPPRSWSSRRTTRRSTCSASGSPTAVAVGTVDKFQGQEADVVLYSMASSSGEDIPRGLEFLLSRNRLNVAISRAQCLAYLVCSPRLLEVNCRTIDADAARERALPVRRACPRRVKRAVELESSTRARARRRVANLAGT